MYPMLREDVSLIKTKNPNSGSIRYFVKNGIEDRFEVSPRLYHALIDAGGTKPLSLPPDKSKKIIPRLNQLFFKKIVGMSKFVILV